MVRILRLEWSTSKLDRSSLSRIPEAVFTTHQFLHSLVWVQQAKALRHTRLESHAWDKHSSLLGPFVSYEKNCVVSMVPGAHPELGTHEKFSAVNSSVLIANIRLD
jgi:hypothetical protein